MYVIPMKNEYNFVTNDGTPYNNALAELFYIRFISIKYENVAKV